MFVAEVFQKKDKRERLIKVAEVMNEKSCESSNLIQINYFLLQAMKFSPRSEIVYSTLRRLVKLLLQQNEYEQAFPNVNRLLRLAKLRNDTPLIDELRRDQRIIHEWLNIDHARIYQSLCDRHLISPNAKVVIAISQAVESVDLSALGLVGTDISCLWGLPSIEEVDVSHNLLETLNLQSLNETSLAHLNVSHNFLTTAELRECVQKFSNLEVLDFSYNRLDNLTMHDFQSLFRFHEVNLNGCCISTIADDGVKHLQEPALIDLSISDNPFNAESIIRLIQTLPLTVRFLKMAKLNTELSNSIFEALTVKEYCI
jgi:hypothetical protein